MSYKCQITFNLNTTHQYIECVQGLKVENSSTQGESYQDYPDVVTGRWSGEWGVHNHSGGNTIRTPVSGPQSSRIAVYLDHSEGILSFYNICEATKNITLLYRVQNRVSWPLCPGFGIYNLKASAKILHDSAG